MRPGVKILVVSYFLAVLLLFLYSFTQVDLNLTLSRVSIWQDIQKWFMYIGYYKRPLSTAIFVSILVALYTQYALFLRLSTSKLLSTKLLMRIIILTGVVLLFSYPAFSHDIFNYMFSAKTIIKYGQLPYFAPPMNFPDDPWLNFMRWIHIPGTYPPLWILLTLPMYLISLNKIVLLIINFKLLAVAAYLGSSFLIGKIMQRINYRYWKAAVVSFALNPLVIIESLVSGHNDVVMAFWMLLSIYLWQKKERLFGVFTLSISVGIKWMSVFLLPLAIVGPRRLLSLVLMVLGLSLVLTRREFLPWYWIWIAPLISLNVDRKFIFIPGVALSFGLLLRYTPFLYLGNWDPPVPMIKFWVTVIPLVTSAIIVILFSYVQKLQKK